MPVYSFECCQCGKEFTKLVRLKDKGEVFCPRCGSREVKQLFRPFNYVKITQKYNPACPLAWNCVSAKRFGCGKYSPTKPPEVDLSELEKSQAE
ncbi:MAG: Transcriptional regulator FmdB family [Thermoanaerobacterales bacterium 50_218]|nr:MAG: Transcriptional regulator FmdB family [Thermoanaerobacterales bacterium 50_218]